MNGFIPRPPRAILLSRAGRPVIDRLVRDVLVPVVRELDIELARVDRAANEPESPRCWVSVVHRLLYACDLALVVMHDAGPNVSYLEVTIGDPHFTPVNYMDSLVEAIVPTGTVHRTRRAAKLYIQLDRGAQPRPAHSIYEGSYWLLLDEDAAPEVNRTAAREVLEHVLVQRARAARLDADEAPRPVQMYEHLRLAIRNDPDVRESTSALTPHAPMPPAHPAVAEAYAHMFSDVRWRRVLTAVNRVMFTMADVAQRARSRSTPAAADARSVYAAFYELFRLIEPSPLKARLKAAGRAAVVSLGLPVANTIQRRAAAGGRTPPGALQDAGSGEKPPSLPDARSFDPDTPSRS
jgi:hypothetical protein